MAIPREGCANECTFATGMRAGQIRPATWNEMRHSSERGWVNTGRRVCGLCSEWGMVPVLYKGR